MDGLKRFISAAKSLCAKLCVCTCTTVHMCVRERLRHILCECFVHIVHILGEDVFAKSVHNVNSLKDK